MNESLLFYEPTFKTSFMTLKEVIHCH